MSYITFTGKNKEEALNAAKEKFGVPLTELEYEVVDEGSTGFLGIGSKPAQIKAKKKFTLTSAAEDFLADVFGRMDLKVDLDTVYNEEEKTMDIDLKGDDMGILIGKRGQTLDSLQYLTSLVVNKYSDEYVRVKLDIENYRERRKETLENLAKNIASKVKRTHREVSLEPMNPYERRIIHSTLQADKYVVTRSEGEEPHRFVIVAPKKERREGGYRSDRGFQKNEGRGNYNRGKKSSVVYKDHDDSQTNEGNEKKSGNRTYGYRTFGYTRREETVATSKHNFDTVDDHGFHETEDIDIED